MRTIVRLAGVVFSLQSILIITLGLLGISTLPAGAGEPGGARARALPQVPGADETWWAAVENQIRQEEYNLEWTDGGARGTSRGAWRANNPAHGFDASFAERGVQLTRRKGEAVEWSWGLEFARWGREGALRDAARAKVRVSANRADLDRGAVREWYINDERGLEQGFTLSAPPAESESGVPRLDVLTSRLSSFVPRPLCVDLALTGDLQPRFSEDGQAVDFYAPGGDVSALRYASLKVTDATGRALPSRFEGWTLGSGSSLAPRLSSAFGGIRIAIDDSNALYPLTVDPLATSPAWTVTGQNTGEHVGVSVATAGDVNGDGYSDVILGADGYGSSTGRAYLYLGGPSGLSSTASWTATGEATSSQFGKCVATAGDVNGDGYGDVLVGAPGYTTQTGRAYLYLGSASGLSTSASWTATGEATHDYFGYSIACAGDVDGDGYSDTVVGAYGNGSNRGKVYVFLGGPSGLPGTADWTAVGENYSDTFGCSVATAGDVEGDGYSDIVIGAYGCASYAGRAYLYSGGASGLSGLWSWTNSGSEAGARHGTCVATAGDVNGDGYSDVLVGASGRNSNTGTAYLFLGASTGLTGAASWVVHGESTGHYFGYCAATAGDINGDGYADVVVGAYGYGGNAGRAYLYLGSVSSLSTSVSWTATGEATTNYLGRSVATAGDVNGDGHSDVVAGAYAYGNIQGRAYAYLGSASDLAAASSWTAEGEASGDGFAGSLALAGDVNGDGYADVVVGASGNGTGRGKAYLYLGGPSGLSTAASWTKTGENGGDNFASTVAGAGDADGDGYADILVGAYAWNNYAGKAYLFLGGAAGPGSTPAWTATGTESYGDFGGSLACAGDVNGDGYSDVIVGEPYSGAGGAAYLYMGSASGLSASASWSKTGDGSGDQYGYCVASAGDVNGDGASDVLVGAPGSVSNTGRAYLYLGGAGGLSTAGSWHTFGGATGDAFGTSLSTAGDTNGDGYSDVVVGASGYGATDTGRAYGYLGGPSGLSESTAWSFVGEAADNFLGGGVAAGGDVDRDGYGDVLVGAEGFGTRTGKVYLIRGSASGLSPTASWTAVGLAANGFFGRAVAGAGDVNGDGFPDVLAGTSVYPSNRGSARLYLGGGGPCVPLLPRQLRSDGSTPIAPLGRAQDGLFQLSAMGRSPFGRSDVRLEWQTAPLGSVFAASFAIPWQDGGTGGAALTQTASLGETSGPYRWRARAQFRPSTTPFQGHGPWLTPAANGVTETDLQNLSSCVPPDEACWIYRLDKSGDDIVLNWEDPNDAEQRTGWNIRRSVDPSVDKTSWTVIGNNVADEDPGTPNYQWTDISGGLPQLQILFYEVTAYNANCPAEGPF